MYIRFRSISTVLTVYTFHPAAGPSFAFKYLSSSLPTKRRTRSPGVMFHRRIRSAEGMNWVGPCGSREGHLQG